MRLSSSPVHDAIARTIYKWSVIVNQPEAGTCHLTWLPKLAYPAR